MLSSHPLDQVEHVLWFDPAVDVEAMGAPIEPESYVVVEGGERIRVTRLLRYIGTADPKVLALRPADQAKPTRWTLRRLTHQQIREALALPTDIDRRHRACRYALAAVDGYDLVDAAGAMRPLVVEHESGPSGRWASDATMNAIAAEHWRELGRVALIISQLTVPFRG